MNKIFIEAKHEKTAEYFFLKAILDKFFPEMEVQFIFMDGIGNLFKESIINQIYESYIEYAVLHVPEESVEYYKNAPVWNTIHKIIPLTDEEYKNYKAGENGQDAKPKMKSDVNGDGNVDINDVVYIINAMAGNN